MGENNQFMMGTMLDEQVMNDWIKETEIRHRESRIKPTSSGVSWFWFVVALIFFVN